MYVGSQLISFDGKQSNQTMEQYIMVKILGAGITGLSAGYSLNVDVFEAEAYPGGICSSYYLNIGNNEKHTGLSRQSSGYRFEIGGGHWIFGGDPLILRFVRSLTPIKFYQRRSAVFFPDRDLFVPYPIQNHLRLLGSKMAAQALSEIVTRKFTSGIVTMDDWLKANFGDTLYDLFFQPFHELYTAGLYKQIAPQDSYKTPVDLKLVIRGAFDEVLPVGYNTNFVYPEYGLDFLAQEMSKRCRIFYGKRVIRIDVQSREIYFEDGTSERYSELISTLPLNFMLEITGLQVDEQTDPATSVLVVNIGAIKGSACPTEHWLYIPRSKAGFHRVGFYSNVDVSFLPSSTREENNRVSIYVEKSYKQQKRPAEEEIKQVSKAIISELQEWGWVKEIEVVDPTWIEVAYTWSYPGSKWRTKALKILEENGIYQIGRYGRWVFQGIADSIKEGMYAGALFRENCHEE